MRDLCGRLLAVTALAALLPVLGALPARAQTTVIENATLLIGDGRTLEEGSLVISGDTIGSIGRQVRAGGLFSRPTKIDATGKYVTPGLIDVWSSPSLNPPTVGSPQGSAADHVDRFNRDWMAAAHRGGVTTLYVPARTQAGFGGLGAVVRLLPGGTREQVFLSERAALCAALGGNGGTQRSKNYTAMNDAFREAREHREAVETYEEDLEEYEKELKEWLEKREKSKDEKGDGDKTDKQPDKGDQDDQANGDKKDGDDAEEGGDSALIAADDPRPRRRRRPGAPPARAKKTDDKKDGEGDKKDDGPKKPARPPRAPDKDILLEAMDGELLWRVETERVADIASALEVAQDYSLALVLEGADGAAWLADQLAEREVPVVVSSSGPPVRGARRDAHPHPLETLQEAGVQVFLGSGPTTATPQLALRAAQAIAAGMDQEVVLKRLMSDAAELLGVADQAGLLGPGRPADVVIWSDHPLAPGARVERVFVAGKEVYVAEEE